MPDIPPPSPTPPAASGPRLLKDDDIADTQAGQELQAEQLNKAMSRARTILLTLAGCLLLMGGFFVVLSAKAPPPSAKPLMIVAVGMLGMGAVFLGLRFWATRDPHAACVVAMVLYGLAWAGESSLRGAYYPAGLILIKLLIMIYLLRGAQAGWRYKKLRAEMVNQQA